MNGARRQPGVAELVFHGAAELDARELCDEEVIAAVESCGAERAAAGLPRIEGCPCFRLSCDGESSQHWPDRAGNLLQENLIARFLDMEEICASRSERLRLYRMSWTAMAADGDEYLLVRPYKREGEEQVAGIVVLCVTQRVWQGADAPMRDK